MQNVHRLTMWRTSSLNTRKTLLKKKMVKENVEKQLGYLLCPFFIIGATSGTGASITFESVEKNKKQKMSQ